jgi:predicted  nucleic acid-binding Zn-ribbon protein
MKLTKTSRSACLLLLIAIFALTSLCSAAPSGKTSIEDVKKETQDLLQTLKGYSAAQRDEAIARIKVTLDDLDQRITALEATIDANWEKMDKTARANARNRLQELHKERTEVAEWYGSLKSSSAEAWEQTKRVFSDAYKDLNEAWEKSEIEFGKRK